jgi:hypothetical protein
MPDLDHRLMHPPCLHEGREYQIRGYVAIWDRDECEKRESGNA